tara:strand:- start:551 stop:835 length:285 start_codon:yes stop_codon:yes gene_type:complete
MTEEFNAQEIHFMKSAIEGAQISGKDSIFTAQVLVKISKWLEAQAGKEGLIQQPKNTEPPVGTVANPHPEGTSLPEGAPPIPGATVEAPRGTNQ